MGTLEDMMDEAERLVQADSRVAAVLGQVMEGQTVTVYRDAEHTDPMVVMMPAVEYKQTVDCLAAVRVAAVKYDFAVQRREHAGVAAAQFVRAVQEALEEGPDVVDA